MRKYSSSAGRLSRMQVTHRLLHVVTAVITLAGVFSFMASASASAATPKPAKLSIAPQSHQYGSVAVGASSARWMIPGDDREE